MTDTSTATSTGTSIDTLTEFETDWRTWHEAHERRRADDHGFLAITSINWLGDEPQRFVDAPGEWTTGPSGVIVDLGSEHVSIDGHDVTGRHEFGVLPERGGVDVVWGDAVIEVAKRGGADIVRPRHPDAPVLAAYRATAGTDAYPARPDWAVEATYVSFDEPRPTTVGSVVDELAHVYDAPGEVRFRVPGSADEQTLTVFPGSSGGSLMVLFTDATSGVTTYAANRSVTLPPPDAAGRLTIDFNRATNLPCAYTAFATCPLPPAENALTVPVEAGELGPR